MDRCDVLIVGGGPAGSTCAGRLRAAGLDVLVRDAAVFPRHKPCAGWITPAVLAELQLGAEEYAREGRTLQPFLAFRTGCIGGPARVTRFPAAVGYGIIRSELDRFLLERSGARVETGRPVETLERVGEGWLVDGDLRTPLLVGAGGHWCPVARRLDGRTLARGCIVAQEVELRVGGGGGALEPGVPELYFCRDLRGYGWCLRKGDYLNVGLGRRDPRALSSHVRELEGFLKWSGRIAPGLELRFEGHAYLVYERGGRRVVGDGALLVGDAAGLASPESGEGIGPAVESGLLAAEAILAANGRHRRQDLEPYRAALERRFGRRRRRFDLPEPVGSRLARALLSRDWFVRHVVLERWFLHRGRPPLAPVHPLAA
ncbi:MAG: FAD-dependent monooxygenase [Vicinamibacteria bacterium]